ncbi:MAG: hypothetical protein M1840_000837 [Geoglossum simile]|nr:MAG: hypothetical protein M1840_000837 [Geoglossum simile]
MPSGTHEVFTKMVVREIESRLQRTSIAGSIECLESMDIALESEPSDDHEYSKCSPDASFALKDDRYPCVVIQNSFSQSKRDLPRLADDYIIGSYGNIKLVIWL